MLQDERKIKNAVIYASILILGLNIFPLTNTILPSIFHEEILNYGLGIVAFYTIRQLWKRNIGGPIF